MSLRVLDPIDRVSEIIFGLLMALTFSGSINVATDGQEEVRTMMLTALGCNLAWGLADAVMYLMRTFTERTRNHALYARLQRADAVEGRSVIAEVIPDGLSAVAGDEALEALRRRVLETPVTALRSRLDLQDLWSALAIFFLVVLATFPVVIPFMIVDRLPLAMRLSNGVSLVMLFICGWMLARHSGGVPWRFGAGLAMFGAMLTAAVIALGG